MTVGKVIEDFRVDLSRFYQIDLENISPSLLEKLKLWVNHHGLHCVMIYRFNQLTDQIATKNNALALPFKCVSRLLNMAMRFFYHVNIAASIGPGFYIGHIGTIYIGNTQIGDNFSVTHNVTIGMGHSKGSTGIPKIENNVWIGTLSVISGDITIGNHVTITNGSMLSRSIPDNCLVGGNPARVILRDYDNSKLILPSSPEKSHGRGEC